MKMQQLRYLVSVADSSSYTQAAKKCFTSRQNVARSINELEEELGVSLCERGDSGIRLTPIGQSVVLQAKIILFDVEELESIFPGDSDELQRITIALSANIMKSAPPAVRDYFVANTDTFKLVEMGCPDCFNAVSSGEAEIALIKSMERSFSNCVSLDLISFPAYVMVGKGHPLANRKSLSVTDVCSYKTILPVHFSFRCDPLAHQMDLLCYDFSQSSRIHCSTLASVILQDNTTIAVATTSPDYFKSEDTVCIPLDDPRCAWHFYLLHRNSAKNNREITSVCSDIRHATQEKD